MCNLELLLEILIYNINIIIRIYIGGKNVFFSFRFIIM